MAPEKEVESSEELESEEEVSSGEDDDDHRHQKQPPEAAPAVDDDDDSEDNDEDEEGEDDHPKQNKATPSNPPPALATLAAAAEVAEADDDDSEEEEGDDDDEGEDKADEMQESKKKKRSDGKPSRSQTPSSAVSKVMNKAQQSAAKTTAPKRASGSNATAADSVELPPSKKAKLASEVDNHLKSNGKQLWSLDDKVAILDGMIRFKDEKGAYPSAKTMDAFHEFISDSITPGRKKGQLSNKIKKLKGLYHSNAQKGSDAIFSTPKDFKCFQLSQMIWAAEATNVSSPGSNSNRKRRKVAEKSGRVKSMKERSKKGISMPNDGLVVRTDASPENVRHDANVFWQKFPRFLDAMDLELSGMLEAEKRAELEAMSKIGIVKATEIEERLKSNRAKEIELDIKHIEVHRERQDLYKEVKTLRLSFMT